MTQDRAKQLIDDACEENLKHLFSVLVADLVTEAPEEAMRQFGNAVKNQLRAVDISSRVITQVLQ